MMTKDHGQGKVVAIKLKEEIHGIFSCDGLQYNSTRVDEGRKMLTSSPDNNEGAYRSGEGGGGPAM